MSSEPLTATCAKTAIAHPNSFFAEFLGLFVRPMGHWAPVSAMVALLAEFGYDSSTVRAMVARQKSRGWLVAEKRGRSRGYRLGDEALDRLAASDAYVWHPRELAPLADGWALVTFSVPETVRARRHLLRSRLNSVGFGTVGPGMLIAPSRMIDVAQRVIADYDLKQFADVFLAHLPAGEDASQLIRRGWDLAGMADDYRAFIDEYRPVLRTWQDRPAVDPEPDPELDREAFRDYPLAFNRWRRLPLKDPGLPSDLLGPDWAGHEAGELFEDLVELLQERAIRFARQHWPEQTDAGSPDHEHRGRSAASDRPR